MKRRTNLVTAAALVVICGTYVSITMLTQDVGFAQALTSAYGTTAISLGLFYASKRRGTLLRPFAGRIRCVEAVAGQQLRSCTWLDRLVDRLLDRAVQQLPGAVRWRWAEEWEDHRTNRRGWRLLWWAVCLRATASRVGREYQPAEVPRSGE